MYTKRTTIQFICGHRDLKIPHPVRSAQSSKSSPSQYCGGGPRGNPRCCSFFIFPLCSHVVWEKVLDFESNVIQNCPGPYTTHDSRLVTTVLCSKMRGMANFSETHDWANMCGPRKTEPVASHELLSSHDSASRSDSYSRLKLFLLSSSPLYCTIIRHCWRKSGIEIRC